MGKQPTPQEQHTAAIERPCHTGVVFYHGGSPAPHPDRHQGNRDSLPPPLRVHGQSILGFHAAVDVHHSMPRQLVAARTVIPAHQSPRQHSQQLPLSVMSGWSYNFDTYVRAVKVKVCPGIPGEQRQPAGR